MTPRLLITVVVHLAFTAGCVATKSSRTPVGGKQATGQAGDAEPVDGPSNQDPGSQDGDEDDGRLIVTGDESPVDANACTPEVDFQAQRAHAISVDSKRVLWVFAAAPSEKSVGVSTCVDGKFALSFLKPLSTVGDVPGQPWASDGKIFVPYATGPSTAIYVLSNLEADAEAWKIKKQVLPLPEVIVGSVVIPPRVMLFTEPTPQTLKLYELGADGTGQLKVVDATFPAKTLRGVSIRADVESSQWLALYASFDGTVISRATDITGPWSEPKVVHQDKDGLACTEATDLPMFTKEPAHETVIAYSCADGATMKFARIELPKD